MNAKQNTAEIVPLPLKKEGQQSSEKKWGKAVINLGFSIVPSLIFHAQLRLGLNSGQLILLLHLADYWWQKENMPHPSKATLAQRMNVKPRTIQRYLTELEDAGFIKRVKRLATNRGQLTNQYDLTGLVTKLQKFEPEFTEVKKQGKRVVTRGGGSEKGSNE